MLSTLCYLRHEVKEGEIGGACSMFGERRGNMRVLLWEHEGKALLRQDTAQRLLSIQDAIAWGGLSWLRMDRSGRLWVP